MALLKFKDECGSEVSIRTSMIAKLEVITPQNCNYDTGRFKIIIHQTGVTPTILRCDNAQEKTDIVQNLEYCIGLFEES